jgi:hypothetical protein
MSGALAQLISRGQQDRHITGNPETTYFHTRFKRHSNFSAFTHVQTLQQHPAAGKFSTVRIQKMGDLLSYITIVADDPSTGSQLITDWRTIIKHVDLYIGGQLIDSQDSEFSEGIAIDLFANTYSKTYPASLHGGVGSQSYFYPLRFFFENWQTSLPLVALNFHDVELKIYWQDDNLPDYTYMVDACFIMLDEDERNFFASTRHDILIYQVQKNEPSNQKSMDCVFSHPVKYLASSNVTADNVNNALVSSLNKVKLQINGVDLVDWKRSVPYYTSIPCYYHSDFSASNTEQLFFHPFCLSAGKYHPTGTLNCSRIDSLKIQCTENINTPVYAVSYNILRVDKGMAGTLYAD